MGRAQPGRAADGEIRAGRTPLCGGRTAYSVAGSQIACTAGLGLGGEGYLSYSIATPTGEGITNPRTFTRVRRCVMVDNLRIY